MTIWIHSTVNRNSLQASDPIHSLPNRLFDAIYNVADIIVGYVWAGRETETYLEESGFRVVGVGCDTCVDHSIKNPFKYHYLYRIFGICSPCLILSIFRQVYIRQYSTRPVYARQGHESSSHFLLQL